jgi:hypothetical protein
MRSRRRVDGLYDAPKVALVEELANTSEGVLASKRYLPLMSFASRAVRVAAAMEESAIHFSRR